MAIPPMNVLIGKDRFGDPQIQIWDGDQAMWREPANTEERVDALMALVLKIGTKLRDLGS
jgi:hypothetical protein